MTPVSRVISLYVILYSLAFFAVSSAAAQSTSVELLGTITANQATNGLGFNLNPANDWEWAAAAAAGATHARIQCSWSIVEQQTAPPENVAASPQYKQDPNCESGFASAAKYHIHPTVVAAYGPPFHEILAVTVPGGAAAGATSLDIQLVSSVGGETLANVVYPYDYICQAQTANGQPVSPGVCLAPITGNHSYQGTLIAGVKLIDSTHATITLASALTRPLPANGTPYLINEILYPSTATESLTDPSVVAYGNYVEFLANDMASHGLSGDVELWNEPVWTADPWDNRCSLFDANLPSPCPAIPGPPDRTEPNYGFVANLQSRKFPAGITLTWNGTSGSGFSSILGARMFAQTGVFAAQPATVVTKESFHPYGNTPEQTMWETSCMQEIASDYSPLHESFGQCWLPGEPQNSNFSAAVQLDSFAKLANPANGVGHEITETGILPPTAGLRIPQARFIMRQFIGFEANGLTPVEFYKLYESPSDPGFSFVEEAGTTSSYTANPSYTAISGFMADIQPISNQPVSAYPSSSLPSVTSYRGTYPLSTVHMVGARSGAKANSDAFMVWQRSFTPCDSNNNCGVWITQASPAAAPVSVNIPSGMQVTTLVNVTTRTAVPYTTSGDTISFSVADDPIEILVDPVADAVAAKNPVEPTSLVVSVSPSGAAYSAPVVLTAVLTPNASKTAQTNGEAVTFFSGQAELGVGTLSSGVATLSVNSLAAGTDTVVARFGGDANFGASTGFTYITISAADPGLKFGTIAKQTFGGAPITVQARSASATVVWYKVLSGPARVSATTSTTATIQFMGVGTVVLQASQPTTTNYSAATAQTSFVIQPALPNLSFRPIAQPTYGNGPIGVKAVSDSTGPITYAVVSGPATISGQTVTFTGAGTVVLSASQPAAGNYTAASVQTTVVVKPGLPTLVLGAVGLQVYGVAPITVSATSNSPAKINYTVVSGPATVSGNKVTLTGAGKVVLGASQPAAGNYQAAAMVETSFVVNPEIPTVIWAPIATPTYGGAPFRVTATSNSSGTITYMVLKGPATISGNTVTVTGAGGVDLGASQAASGNYAASPQVKTSFVVKTEDPGLKFGAIAAQTYGGAPITVQARSASATVVWYKVLSGPARVSATTSTTATIQFMGVGTVVLQASQPTTTNYSAATAQISFVIQPALPNLSFRPIAQPTYGNGPIGVKAVSDSTGPITYAVVSGPATISGQTVTFTGAGTVVLSASQPAAGNYTAASAQTTVVVKP